MMHALLTAELPFVLTATICSGLLGIIWTKMGLVNFIIKVLFIVVAIWGAMVAGNLSGILISIGG